MTAPGSSRCTATTKVGAPCGMAAVDGGPYCYTHAPERARDRAESRRRGGKRRQTPKAPPQGTEAQGEASAPPVRLRDVGSIQAELEQAVADTKLQENSAQRSRTIGYLLGHALAALEVGELEERLAALESRLDGLGAGAPTTNLRRVG